jgi:molecular chaperone DnaK (HSP70)
VRQLEGLVTNTMRSVQALEGKLTTEEQRRILDSIEKARKTRSRLVGETRKSEGKSKSKSKSKEEQEGVVRQLDGLVANTMRSVQALEGKLTAEEQQHILDWIEKAKKTRNGGSLGQRLRTWRRRPRSSTGLVAAALMPRLSLPKW